MNYPLSKGCYMSQRRLHHSATSIGGLLLIALLGAYTPASAEPTDLKIMVRAADAKFIGSGVGGMNVIVEDAHSGELLASGEITGGTGNTPALMTEGQTRGRAPVEQGDASFNASLDISTPRQVKVSIVGPLAVAQSAQATSVTLWLVPGRHQTEPGVVLQLPGLITELVDYTTEGLTISVTAHVSMICGCPIMTDGLWPAEDYVTVAQLYRDGERVAESKLGFTGKTNEFAGEIGAPASGPYELVIYAYQHSMGNTGVFRQSLRLP
jgi:hypothetical protein